MGSDLLHHPVHLCQCVIALYSVFFNTLANLVLNIPRDAACITSAIPVNKSIPVAGFHMCLLLTLTGLSKGERIWKGSFEIQNTSSISGINHDSKRLLPRLVKPCNI